MLKAGMDVLLVARMAGTSVAMIERVYGHFRSQSYREAQARLDRVRGDTRSIAGGETCERANVSDRGSDQEQLCSFAHRYRQPARKAKQVVSDVHGYHVTI
jgi:hypothetical protein